MKSRCGISFRCSEESDKVTGPQGREPFCIYSAAVAPKCHCNSHNFSSACCVLSTRPGENWRSAQEVSGIACHTEILVWHSSASKWAVGDATQGSKSANVIGA